MITRDPLGAGAICHPCGAYHPTAAEAAQCHPVPVMPGVPMPPHRPSYVPAGAKYDPGPRTYRAPAPRWARVALGLGLALLALAAVLFIALTWPRSSTAAPGCGGMCVPTTYGAPGPNGGPAEVDE